jgi:hypothetical protein
MDHSDEPRPQDDRRLKLIEQAVDGVTFQVIMSLLPLHRLEFDPSVCRLSGQRPVPEPPPPRV